MHSSVSLFTGILVFASHLLVSFTSEVDDNIPATNETFQFCGCNEIHSGGKKLVNIEGARILDFYNLSWTTATTPTENSVSKCSNYCSRVLRASHFTIITNVCQCYSNLKPFHCEEEEGAQLANVYCIENRADLEDETQRGEVDEPIFLWRRKLMLPTLQDLGAWVQLEASSAPEDPQVAMVKDEKILSTTESRNETDVTTSSTLPMEASIILVTVLVVAALLLLIGMCSKTWIDVRRQKKIEQEKQIEETKEEYFTTIVLN